MKLPRRSLLAATPALAEAAGRATREGVERELDAPLASLGESQPDPLVIFGPWPVPDGGWRDPDQPTGMALRRSELLLHEAHRFFSRRGP